MGSTITTDIQTGTVIIALLALLSSLAATHLWNLFIFVAHQLRADGRSADGLFWQQQILLRAELSPTTFLVDWLKLWWLSRSHEHSAKRSIPQIPVALLFIFGTIAVSIFSSYVVTSTNLQVLVHNPLCGPFDFGSGPGSATFGTTLDGILNYRRDIIARSQPFAEDCYQNSTSLPARCMAFIQPNSPLTPELTRCPFDSKTCIDNEDQSGVSIDSGLIDTNGIFGWNFQARDRVQRRRKTTCGILRTEGYTEVINASDYPIHTNRNFLPGEQLLASRYGSRESGSNFRNITFVHSLLEANISQAYSHG
jgi:hypothetical protein